MTTCGSATALLVDTVVAHARDRLMEAQLAEVFERVLALHQRARRRLDPVDEAREQETHGGAACQQRQRAPLGARQWPPGRVGLEQVAPLGHVIGVVRLEAPRVEAD